MRGEIISDTPGLEKLFRCHAPIVRKFLEYMLHQTQGASQERRRPRIQVTQAPAQEGGQRDAQEVMKGGFRASAVLQTKTGNQVQAGIRKNPSEENH